MKARRRVNMKNPLKIALIVEALLAYVYVSLTNGVFLAYLAFLGYDTSMISSIVLGSSFPAILIGYMAFRKPNLLSSVSKKRLIVVHASERLIWLVVPFMHSFEALIAVYFVKNLFSVLISLQFNNIIFSVFDEQGVRDVTSKRSSLASVSSILGYFLATIFLSAGETGFYYSFIYGALIGLASTAVIALPDMKIPLRETPAITNVENIYSVSLYQVLYVASASLLSIFWVSIIVKGMGLESYWVTMISLVGTATSIFASLFWGRAQFKYYKFSLAFDALTPLLVVFAKNSFMHLGISTYGSFFGTGSGFLGSFLYARYMGSLGPMRASSLLIMLGGLGQFFGSLIGSFGQEFYLVLAVAVVVLRMGALFVAFLTIPEVALVPGYMARNYASILYMVSVLGYRLSIEVSKESAIITLRIIVLTVSLLVLYVIYKAAIILLGV